MPTTHHWLAFLLASVVFIQVPGPSLLFTLGRALTVGRREALLSVVGNGLGLAAQVVLVALGLGALVAASAGAYTAVKVVGASYVIWLGVQAFRHRGDARAALGTASAAATTAVPASHSLRIGAVVGLTNPKTIVFFAAFLPQFTGAGAPVWAQTLLLGLVFCVLAVASDTVWALVASRAREWFARRPERLDQMGATGGVMMVALGVTTLAVE